jgi:bifunctional DNA-binding transcriptional regulator/antitoxin component of YhaV-PrlF toxin-antitoxin module
VGKVSEGVMVYLPREVLEAVERVAKELGVVSLSQAIRRLLTERLLELGLLERDPRVREKRLRWVKTEGGWVLLTGGRALGDPDAVRQILLYCPRCGEPAIGASISRVGGSGRILAYHARHSWYVGPAEPPALDAAAPLLAEVEARKRARGGEPLLPFEARVTSDGRLCLPSPLAERLGLLGAERARAKVAAGGEVEELEAPLLKWLGPETLENARYIPLPPRLAARAAGRLTVLAVEPAATARSGAPSAPTARLPLEARVWVNGQLLLPAGLVRGLGLEGARRAFVVVERGGAMEAFIAPLVKPSSSETAARIVTIPKSVRERLGLSPFGGEVTVRRVEPVG